MVQELETGNLTLSDSLKCYETGIRSLKNCYRRLEAAEQQIGMLVSLDDQGRIQTREFDDSATYSEEELQAELTRELEEESTEDDGDDVDDSTHLF